MRIRQANIQDSAGIARVQVDSYQTAYVGILPQDALDQFTYEEQTRDWQEWPTTHPDDLLYVAETDEGEIVGYALARLGVTDVSSYESELLALHVRRSYHRQGVGRQLVAAIAGQLAQQECTSMMLWVLEANPARGFYERLGGQLLDEKSINWAGVPEVAYGWSDIERLYA